MVSFIEVYTLTITQKKKKEEAKEKKVRKIHSKIIGPPFQPLIYIRYQNHCFIFLSYMHALIWYTYQVSIHTRPDMV